MLEQMLPHWIRPKPALPSLPSNPSHAGLPFLSRTRAGVVAGGPQLLLHLRAGEGGVGLGCAASQPGGGGAIAGL